MRHRPEIDGLRAVAVLAVMLFHAGFRPFAGGFVGVDVFFVISGFLIAARIADDLAAGRFGLGAFYERRARRLLPALLVVMIACVPFAYLWMLPNDLGNFGQSLVATSLFLNNVLLLKTTGYWSLPAEFKPLLHTWSLGIEEQFYVLFPLLMLAGWRLGGRRLAAGALLGAAASLAAAQWLSAVDPVADFFLAPTRAWEFLAGALVALHLRGGRARATGGPGGRILSGQVLSGIGLALVAGAVAGFGAGTPTPSLLTLMPVCGAALVLAFAVEGTLAHRLLAHRLPVGIGLISYSLYLWHQPLIAFARVYRVEPPGPALLGALLALAFPLAYLSWRFVEQPFRARGRVGGRVGRTAFVAAAVLLSAALVTYGYVLHRTRGLPGRLYPGGVAADDLYIAYNDGAFRFRRDAFARPGALHVLVAGNSFARDFVNMTVETFDLAQVEIVYRDDLRDCLPAWTGPAARTLLAAADVIVLANRSIDHGCVGATLAEARARGKPLFYAGGKHFGANQNWLMRLSPEARRGQFNPLMPEMARKEARDAAAIPPDHFISLLAPVVRDGAIPITDAEGRLLGTPDRTHLTRFGARYFGARVLPGSPFGAMLRDARPR